MPAHGKSRTPGGESRVGVGISRARRRPPDEPRRHSKRMPALPSTASPPGAQFRELIGLPEHIAELGPRRNPKIGHRWTLETCYRARRLRRWRDRVFSCYKSPVNPKLREQGYLPVKALIEP